MPTVVIEETVTGTLQFEFADKWQVYKYDEQCKGNFYEAALKQKGLKAVDFIAVSDKTVLLIEVKNITANNRSCGMRLAKSLDDKIIEKVSQEIQTSKVLSRLDKGRVTVVSKRPYLAEEVVKKYKDTMLGLLAAYHQNDTKLRPYYQAIFIAKKPVILLLFLERTEHLNQAEHFKPLASHLKLAIKQKTDFLCANVGVINSLTLATSLGIKVSKRYS